MLSTSFRRHVTVILGCVLTTLSSHAIAQSDDGVTRGRRTSIKKTDKTQPVELAGQLVYPEGWPIGAEMTPIEASWSKDNFTERSLLVNPPTGPIRCVAEYEPMDGILVAWEGSNSWKSILAEMASHITTTGDANIYVMVDNNSEGNSAQNSIVAAGANEDRVIIIVRTTDTIWIRDYGPRFIMEGQCRAIVDHNYNRPRPSDNALNSYLSTYWDFPNYEIPLTHGGGNYHLNAVGESFATELIVNENPGLSESQIVDYWQDYQNLNTTLTPAFPTSVDFTQHIDMWMQIAADNLALVSDWPNNVGSNQDNICDNTTADLTTAGWTVLRPPARSVGGVHYTYTNVVLCNDLLLIPSYDSLPSENAQALAVWQSALPDKTIVQVDCDAIVTASGVMHCIVMHIPSAAGGEQPTAYLRSPRGGEFLEPGGTVDINWIADDNGEVTIDLVLSTNGGQDFDQTIASGLSDSGSYSWTVPDVYSEQARIRIVARDDDNNTGSDQSDSDITINGTPELIGDINLDGIVDLMDFSIFLVDFGLVCAPNASCGSDLDNSGIVDITDFGIFLVNYGNSL